MNPKNRELARLKDENAELKKKIAELEKKYNAIKDIIIYVVSTTDSVAEKTLDKYCKVIGRENEQKKGQKS